MTLLQCLLVEKSDGKIMLELPATAQRPWLWYVARAANQPNLTVLIAEFRPLERFHCWRIRQFSQASVIISKEIRNEGAE